MTAQEVEYRRAGLLTEVREYRVRRMSANLPHDFASVLLDVCRDRGLCPVCRGIAVLDRRDCPHCRGTGGYG